MHVLHVSTRDMAGGAERIAWDLFQATRQRGHSTHLLTGLKLGDDPDVLEIPNNACRNPWSHAWGMVETMSVKRRIPRIPFVESGAHRLADLGEPHRLWDIQRGIEDFDYPASRRLLDLVPQRPDIIHAHNLHGGYFDLRALPALSCQVPVVLTLHDAWLLSGHCAHSFHCERWTTGCGLCPDLTIYPAVRRDGTAYNWQRKLSIYARSRVYIVTPCRWLMDKVHRSMLQAAVVESRIIPHGIDLSVFHPGDKQVARQELGLPQNAWVALFVGHGTRSNRFKDYDMMEAAVERVAAQSSRQGMIFICLGEEGPERRSGSTVIRFVGHQRDVTKVAQFYRAADIYLHAARAEVWGLAITEALACGTPVVATSVGGISEQIDEGMNGFLVPAGDSSAMASRILQLREDARLWEFMSAQAAQSARHRFSLDRMVNEYIAWYQEILVAADSSRVEHG